MYNSGTAQLNRNTWGSVEEFAAALVANVPTLYSLRRRRVIIDETSHDTFRSSRAGFTQVLEERSLSLIALDSAPRAQKLEEVSHHIRENCSWVRSWLWPCCHGPVSVNGWLSNRSFLYWGGSYFLATISSTIPQEVLPISQRSMLGWREFWFLIDLVGCQCGNDGRSIKGVIVLLTANIVRWRCLRRIEDEHYRG